MEIKMKLKIAWGVFYKGKLQPEYIFKTRREAELEAQNWDFDVRKIEIFYPLNTK